MAKVNTNGHEIYPTNYDILYPEYRMTVVQSKRHHQFSSEKNIAAFICEPIVGCGGQVPLAKGYLKPVYDAIHRQGGICISDEVQTGFGRLGDVFWGFEEHNVEPDMVVIGKPMGNGHPMGAVITSEEISNSFEMGVEFFSSFGGNPVSCAKAEQDFLCEFRQRSHW